MRTAPRPGSPPLSRPSAGGRWGRLSPSAVLALTLLAAGLRFWHLGAQSLWLDEGLSVVFASRDPLSLLATLAAQDLHPPVYYLLLHVTIALAGTGEFVVRFPSALAGVVLVPLTYHLGHQLFGGTPAARAIGLLGAAGVALSPFLVYYAQETRMYALLTLLSLLSSLCLWRAVHSPDSPRWWLAYSLTTLLGLGTQYVGLLTVLAQGTFVLLRFRLSRPTWRWAGSLLLAGLAYAPWLPSALAQARRLWTTPDFWPGSLAPGAFLERLLTAFVPAPTLPPVGALALGLGGLGVGLLIGLARLHRSTPPASALVYLTCLTIIPAGSLYLLTARAPKFAERYLIACLPAFLLLVSAGTVLLSAAGWRRRWSRPFSLLGAGLMAALLLSSGHQTWRVLTAYEYQRDDYRSAVHYIEQNQEPGDRIILLGDSRWAFMYYYRGLAPWTVLVPHDDTTYAAAFLTETITPARRVWVLLWNADWADPTSFVRAALDEHLTRLPVYGHFKGLELRLYRVEAPPVFTPTPPEMTPRPATFGKVIGLRGYHLDPTTLPAGGRLRLTLYWQALRSPGPDDDYAISLRLRRGGEHWWRTDRPPGAETYPTTLWRTGRLIPGTHDLTLPAWLPPGSYHLELAVYHRPTRRELDLLDSAGRPQGVTLDLATLTVLPPVQPPDPATLPLQRRLDTEIAPGLRLLGTLIEGEETAPGLPLRLALAWQTTARPTADYRVRLWLDDAQQQRHLLFEGRPVVGDYPTTAWSPGLFLDRYTVFVPPTAAAGQGRLAVTLAAGQTETPAVVLGSLTITGRPRRFTPPSGITSPTDYQIGAVARLIGYALEPDRPQAGGHLRLILFWQATGTAPVSYTVFAHLLDPNERVVAQRDSPPLGGAAPTTGWLAGEYLRDSYEITLPADLPPGTYQIEVGMYDPRTGQRQPVRDRTGAVIGDRLLLAPVTISPP